MAAANKHFVVPGFFRHSSREEDLTAWFLRKSRKKRNFVYAYVRRTSPGRDENVQYMGENENARVDYRTEVIGSSGQLYIGEVYSAAPLVPRTLYKYICAWGMRLREREREREKIASSRYSLFSIGNSTISSRPIPANTRNHFPIHCQSHTPTRLPATITSLPRSLRLRFRHKTRGVIPYEESIKEFANCRS